jgi:hypothetical protein
LGDAIVNQAQPFFRSHDGGALVVISCCRDAGEEHEYDRRSDENSAWSFWYRYLPHRMMFLSDHRYSTKYELRYYISR